jgi:hypothetical protein
MNPLRWHREYQVAWFLTALLGAFVGFLWGIHQAPAHYHDEWSGSMIPFTLNQIIENNWNMLCLKGAAGILLSSLAFYIWKLMRA